MSGNAGFGIYGGVGLSTGAGAAGDTGVGWTGGAAGGVPGGAAAIGAAPTVVVEPTILQALVRIGISQACAQQIVDAHQIATPVDLSELDDDDVVMLCGILRKPGGVDAYGDPNRGHEVSMKGQMQLQNAAAYCKVRIMCRDNLIPNDITTTSVSPYKLFRVDVEKWEDPTTVPKVLDNDWPKCFQLIYEYLRMCKGMDGAPLSCVIKPNDDMVFTPSSDFTSPRDEIEAKISFAAKQMPSMSRKVFEKLEEIFNSHHAATHLKPFRKNRDGRGAWLALTANYLGGNGMHSQAIIYESKVEGLRYYKDTARSNLDSILTEWLDAITGLKNLVPLGYSMMDESTQVRHLMDVIQHPVLKSACNPLILADDSFRRDVRKCMYLYLDFWRNAIANKRGSNSLVVSALKENELTKYVPPEEYNRLSPGEKKRIYEARKQAASEGDTDDTDSEASDSEGDAVATDDDNNGSSDDESSTSEEEPEPEVKEGKGDHKGKKRKASTLKLSDKDRKAIVSAILAELRG